MILEGKTAIVTGGRIREAAMTDDPLIADRVSDGAGAPRDERRASGH